MRRIRPTLYYITLMLICQLTLIATGVVAKTTYADANNFYFSDFTGDYYLEKDEAGVSRLKVKESVTAEFPDYKQNKGICRQIAYTNQGGANITLPDLNTNNLKVTRNGSAEPIYSIGREKNYYDVCTGTDEYVLGTQIYTFEYGFENVVTDFDNYQELYWDTNGTGASQRFDQVTARIHFVDKDVFTGKKWCYVGKYGTSNQSRCEITEISDGVEFTAKNLSAHENLTFDVELTPGSFVVKTPPNNYTFVWLTVGLGAVCLLILILVSRRFIKARDKLRFYKDFFVKPEYQSHKTISLPEMAEIYIGKKKDVKVAMLLELVVDHKIEFQKNDRNKWSILVKDLTDVSKEYQDLLGLLNSGAVPSASDKIGLKPQLATSKTVALNKSMQSEIVSNLKKHQLVEEKYTYGRNGSRGLSSAIASAIVMCLVMIFLGIFILTVLDEWFGFDAMTGVLVFEKGFYITAVIMITITTFVVTILNNQAKKCKYHTLEGLKMSRYMDGLKLYIEMAEAERMKMLQSVKGADTSPAGVVRLYEKLLPYAAVFGLEESWMNEMKEYCKLREIGEPDYLMHGIIMSDMMRAVRSASNYATTASRMSSSGGGLSSGFSGGGGGGFSGGGGGGGGFGGR